MNNEKYSQIIDEAYENYEKKTSQLESFVVKSIAGNRDEVNELLKNNSTILTQEEFIDKCKTDPEFSETWGLKIEERELSLEERCKLANFAPFDDRFPEDNSLFKWDEHTIGIANGWLEQHHSNLPTKLITITYNNETIEVYE